MNRQLFPLVSVVAEAILAGCASKAPNDQTRATGSPSPTQPAITLAMPDRINGTGVLKEASPITGSQLLGTIAVKPGDLWISVTCQGDGTVRVELSPGVQLGIPCQAGKQQYSKNKDVRTSEQTLDVRVTAPETVHWAMRIEQ